MRRPRQIERNTITRQQARTQLVMLLAGCTDAALEGFTATKLAGLYRVTLKEAEYELAMARQRRAANG